jgi:hypothetical protein
LNSSKIKISITREFTDNGGMMNGFIRFFKYADDLGETNESRKSKQNKSGMENS